MAARRSASPGADRDRGALRQPAPAPTPRPRPFDAAVTSATLPCSPRSIDAYSQTRGGPVLLRVPEKASEGDRYPEGDVFPPIRARILPRPVVRATALVLAGGRCSRSRSPSPARPRAADRPPGVDAPAASRTGGDLTPFQGMGVVGRPLRRLVVVRTPAAAVADMAAPARSHALPRDVELQPAVPLRGPSGVPRSSTRRTSDGVRSSRGTSPVRRHPPRTSALDGGRDLPHRRAATASTGSRSTSSRRTSGPVGAHRAAARSVGPTCACGGRLPARRHHPVAARHVVRKRLLAGVPVREPRGDLRRVHAHVLLHLARLGFGGHASYLTRTSGSSGTRSAATRCRST